VSGRGLFALLFFTYGYFFHGGFDNQNSRFDASLAIALEGRLAIDSFADNTIDRAQVGGHFYCEKAPGTTLLALPVALLAAPFVDVDDVRRSAWVGNLLLYAATLLVSAIVAWGGVRFRRLLLQINPALDPRWALGLTLAIFAGSLVLPYASLLVGHALAAAVLVIALSLGLERRTAAAGAVIGAAVIVEYPVAILAAAISITILLPRPRDLWRLVAGGAPFAILLGVYNTIAFGRPWSFGYGALEGTPFADTMARGVAGITGPRLSIAWQLLAGEYRGLFVYVPLLLLALAGFWFWPKSPRLRIGLPILAGCLAFLLLHSGYGYWQGGVAFGPRHLVAMIPLLGLGLAFWPRRRLVVGAFAAVSLVIALAGTVTTPFVDERDTTPLRGSYLGLVRAGAVSVNPRNFATPTREAALHGVFADRYPLASFNLGELVGLRGWISLAPLVLVWFIALGRRGSTRSSATSTCPAATASTSTGPPSARLPRSARVSCS
jgi:hypothetical protein